MPLCNIMVLLSVLDTIVDNDNLFLNSALSIFKLVKFT